MKKSIPSFYRPFQETHLLFYLGVLHLISIFESVVLSISFGGLYNIAREAVYVNVISYLFIYLLFKLHLPSIMYIVIEGMYSFTFLLYIFIIHFLVGGFWVNSGTLLVATIVPFSLLLLYNIKRRIVIIRIFFCILLTITVLICSLIFETQLSALLGKYLLLPELTVNSSVLFIYHILLFMFVVFVLLFSLITLNENSQRKLEIIINDVIPVNIANKIIDRDEYPTNEYFDKSGILIADIVDFTKLSSELSPTILVKKINELFSYWDDYLLQVENLEKIKTIGDAYIVGTGLHTPLDLTALVKAANTFLELKKKTVFQENQEYTIQIRMAIHIGKVYGGILGDKYFYDIWGQTVTHTDDLCNLAEIDKLLISSETKAILDSEYKNKGIKGTFTPVNLTVEDKDIIGYYMA